MKYHARLLHLYPDYAEGDWEVTNRGAGEFVSKWNRVEPQPTPATIEAVAEADADAARQESFTRREIDDFKAIKALAFAVADNIPGKTRAQFAKEVRDIYKTL